jgi:glycosyltransferase involved in cell wall biosynthesis
MTRAFLLAKKGEIARPLRLLEFGTWWNRDASLLNERLADMDRVLKQPQARAHPIEQPRELKSFNGNALFAFHSLGAYDPSGYASRSVSMVNALQKANVNIYAVVRPGYPWDLANHRVSPRLDQLDYQGSVFGLFPDSPVTLHSPESRYIEVYADLICRQIEGKDISVLHAASNYLNGIAVARAGNRAGIKSVYELRGLWHLTRAFSDPDYAKTEHYRYVEKRELEACLLVDQVITLSDAMADWLEARGIAREKITVVGNAIFSPECESSGRSGCSVREKLGIPEGACVVGYLGSIVEYEGLDLLIYAHAAMPKISRPYLLIVGGGKVESALKDLAKRIGTSDRVIFSGRVTKNEVSSYYYAMDVVALPRKDDLLTRLVPAIKPFEVVAHNKPLLVSSALSNALRGTLPEEAYTVVDFADSQSFSIALEGVKNNLGHLPAPTWDDRAQEVINVYKKSSCHPEGA